MELQVALLFAYFGILAVHGTTTIKETTVTLDPEEKFNVSWTFDGTTPSSYITFTITCRTTGWVGIGLSPNGDMIDADLMVGWVDADGSSHLLDMYATSNGVPVEDMSQDVTLIYADESDGVTTVKFKRRIDTCDVDEDNTITSSTTRLVYAYKDSDPKNGKIGSSDYHGAINRGVKSIYLLESKGVNKPESFPTDTLSFDLTANNYNMPAVDTVYYCSFYEPPVLDTRHHIVAIEAMITEGNLALVHHIVLYGCWGIEDEHLRNNNKTEGVCDTPEMPEFTHSCASTLHAWAVGGEIFYYPEEAGFPIGGTDGTAPQYYMMETHYDNPGLLDTWVDSSGLRLIYSPSLREQDAGSIPVGLVQGIAVPPLANDIRSTGFCDSSCTNQWIPDEGIQVFGYFLHTHLLGTSIQVDWYRDEKHIDVLAYDETYDFNFQQSRHFESNKKLMPGDTVKVTCNYSSPTTDQVTYGGYATADEMCIVYLLYYPLQDISLCLSVPNLYYDDSDPVYESLSLNASKNGGIHVLDEVTDWTNDAVTILQSAFDTSPHYSICYKRDYSTYEGFFQDINASQYKYQPRKSEISCPTVKGIASAQNAVSHSISAVILAVVFILVF